MRAEWRFDFPDATAERLYAVAADVESYPDFLPGCVAARVAARRPDRLLVDNVFGMGPMRVKFRTTAFPEPPERLRVTSQDGPWRRFDLEWRFADLAQGGAAAELAVEAAFRSPLLEGMAGAAFARLEQKLVAAFHRRLALTVGR